MWTFGALGEVRSVVEPGVPPVRKPKDSVRRLLTAAGVGVPDKEAFWLVFHMERFVNCTRKSGELLDLPTASGMLIVFFRDCGFGAVERAGDGSWRQESGGRKPETGGRKTGPGFRSQETRLHVDKENENEERGRRAMDASLRSG